MKSNPTTGMQRLRRYTLISLTLFLAACTQFTPEEEGEDKGFSGTIEEWPNKDTIRVKPDSVRYMTHEDSIRFGYFKE